MLCSSLQLDRWKKKSGCNEYITPAVVTRHIFICLFLRFNEYIHLELGCRSNGSTCFQTSLKVLWKYFEWTRPFLHTGSILTSFNWISKNLGNDIVQNPTSPLYPTLICSASKPDRYVRNSRRAVLVIMAEQNASKPRARAPATLFLSLPVTCDCLRITKSGQIGAVVCLFLQFLLVNK